MTKSDYPFPPSKLGLKEFLTLVAFLTSLGALSIDALMPAFGAMIRDLGLDNPNKIQLVIGVYFLGFSAGQLFYGPFSDAYGRRPAILAGNLLFLLGCIICMISKSFHIILLGRLLQGLGIASARVVTAAIIRDRFKGNEMARLMSLIMTVFVLIPILAPGMGQLILLYVHWPWLFVFFFLLGLITLIWFWIRQPETLSREKRVSFSFVNFFTAVKTIMTNRQSLVYTLSAGFIFGAFLGYLHSAQQLLQVQYMLGKSFSVYFGILAVALGLASFFNSRLVMKMGMHRLISLALYSLFDYALFFALYLLLLREQPDFWVFYCYLFISFFSIGILFGNLNAAAMQPHGKIAGSASTIIGFVQSVISLGLGLFIGQIYNGTVWPLVGGFGVLSCMSIFLNRWVLADT